MPGRHARSLLAALAAVALASAVPRAAAQAPAAAPARPASRTYDLPRILALADRNHPNIAQARAKVRQVRAQLDEAHYAPYSNWNFTAGVGLAPTVRGNSVYSPNTADLSVISNLGVGWRAGIDALIPLWTFGKITNLWDAAEANVKVNEATLEKERDAVRLDVRKAYFGILLARDSKVLLGDVREAIQKGLDRLEEQVESDEGDPIELLKLQTYSAELEVREAEVRRYETIALAGLRFYSGVADLEVPDVPLAPPRHRLGHVSRYLVAARVHRPEMAMARAGVAARTAQVELARSQMYPNIGLAFAFGFATAPEVANQINPFVSDAANSYGLGFGLGLQWKLDFIPAAARIRFAEAQLEEVRAQERYALGGVGAEVETAYAEVLDWQTRVEAYAKAQSYAKRWLVRVQSGIDVGTLEEADLLEPAKAYATQRYNFLNATMELDMAMSRLAKATGWDAIAPDGK